MLFEGGLTGPSPVDRARRGSKHHLLVDAAGVILFGSQDDRLYALEPNGYPRWSVELGGDVDSSPVLDRDGTIYVGADDGNLYALRARQGVQ